MGRCLIEVKTAFDPATAMDNWLNQVLAYALLDWSDALGVDTTAVYLGWQALLISESLTRVLAAATTGTTPRPDLDHGLRTVAARTADVLDRTASVPVLAAMIAEVDAYPNHDPDDELRGIALSVLWPGHLTADMLAASLTTPQHRGLHAQLTGPCRVRGDRRAAAGLQRLEQTALSGHRGQAGQVANRSEQRRQPGLTIAALHRQRPLARSRQHLVQLEHLRDGVDAAEPGQAGVAQQDPLELALADLAQPGVGEPVPILAPGRQVGELAARLRHQCVPRVIPGRNGG